MLSANLEINDPAAFTAADAETDSLVESEEVPCPLLLRSICSISMNLIPTLCLKNAPNLVVCIFKDHG